MEAGLKKAMMADSDDVPGPHVSPAAGIGSGTSTMVAAAARNKTARTVQTTRTAPNNVTVPDRR